MKRQFWQIKIFLVVVGGAMLACQAVTGIPEADVPAVDTAIPAQTENDPAPPPAPAPGQDESCLEGESFHADEGLCYRDDGSAEPLFLALMASATEYDENFEEKLLDDEYVLVTYTVAGNEIVSPDYADVGSDLDAYQNDTAKQERIWAYYAGMIPPDARASLSNYVVMTDGLGGTLAAVEQSPSDPRQWMLNIDIADTDNLPELTFTLIHEFGHLLTLNASQVNIDEYLFNNPEDEDAYLAAEENCATYFPGEGCTTDSAYLYQFYTKFWADIYNEWQDIQYIEDDEEYYAASDEFYFKYEDRFLTDYAATNTEEDIAESWSFFVIKEKPTGNSIADQKVLFFYQFPELVTLREQIIARTYSRMLRIQK